MKSPRVRFTVRRMLVVAVTTIGLAVGGIVAPDLYRRWCNCREKADYHAARAVDPYASAASRAEELAACRRFRLALWIPWRFYSLGELTLESEGPGEDGSGGDGSSSGYFPSAESLAVVPAMIMDAARKALPDHLPERAEAVSYDGNPAWAIRFWSRKGESRTAYVGAKGDIYWIKTER
jgi:hypothetical protein